MLEIGYLSLTVVISFLLVFAYNYGLKRSGYSSQQKNQKIAKAIASLVLWFSYVFLLAKSGFIQNYSLPPRFPVFLIFPLFFFTGFVLLRNQDHPIFRAIPRSWPIYFQSFRILVETLFVASVTAGIMHPEVTIEGYNYDMVFAFSALVAGLLIYTLRLIPEKWALYWNYLGLAVLASVIMIFTTTIFIPSLWGSSVPLAPKELAAFPYILVAGFLMPVAVFVHVFSIIQLKNYLKLKS